jgi:hypothetical protein
MNSRERADIFSPLVECDRSVDVNVTYAIAVGEE